MNPAENENQGQSAKKSLDQDSFERSVEAARLATGIEDIIDAQSAVIGHELEGGHESLTIEETEEIGEKGLNAAEVKDPSDTEKQALFGMYERHIIDVRIETANDLAKVLTKFEEQENAVSDAQQAINNQAEAVVTDLYKILRNEDYPLPAARTKIQETIDSLYTLQSSTRQLGESTLEEIRNALIATEGAVALHGREAQARDDDFKAVANERGLEVPEDTESASYVLRAATDRVSGLDDLRSSLNTLESTVAELSQRRIPEQIIKLEQIVKDSYVQQFDVESLGPIARAIQGNVGSEELQGYFSKTDQNVKEVTEQVRHALKLLNLA